jgi:polyhydroxyalkanoate synthesis regulator phasin
MQPATRRHDEEAMTDSHVYPDSFIHELSAQIEALKRRVIELEKENELLVAQLLELRDKPEAA